MKITGWLLLLAIGFWIWFATEPKRIANRNAEITLPDQSLKLPAADNPSKSPQFSPHRIKAGKDAPAPQATASKPANHEQPPADDPFSRRKLDLRKPKSVADLNSHLTPYIEPMLDNGLGDGDVTSTYRGYYLSDDGKLNRIQIARSPSPHSLSFESKDGRYHEFNADKMKVSNFESDPYSLVIAVPGGVFVYLKFRTRVDIAGLNDSWFRAYEGWIFPSRQPVLIVDGYEPFRDPNNDEWPNPEAFRPLLKNKLPEN